VELKGFNPNFGGLNRDATLIVAGRIYQDAAALENLKTTGIYIYPDGSTEEEGDRT